MDKGEVWRLVDRALDNLRDCDAYLLEVDASERSITHKLAVHLAMQFSGWDVDCEYNRVLVPNESLSQPKKGKAGKPRSPDIVVHRRGHQDNLLIIEIKKASASQAEKDKDEHKIKHLKAELHYTYAACIVIKTGSSNPGRTKVNCFR